jgi:hypothetical protein
VARGSDQDVACFYYFVGFSHGHSGGDRVFPTPRRNQREASNYPEWIRLSFARCDYAFFGQGWGLWEMLLRSDHL